ncbi:MAG: lipoprotein [Novosphingobium sp.]|nr:lipoprotein [Novosphingobium sp.]
MRSALVLFVLMALAACGQKTDLKPVAGKQLPVAPYGTDTRRTSAQLLTPPAQTEPERSVELRKRSEERADDPFDLPPQE